MNAVDRSDKILSTFNIQRKCLRWWKTMFFHLIDIAVVNIHFVFRTQDYIRIQVRPKYKLAIHNSY